MQYACVCSCKWRVNRQTGSNLSVCYVLYRHTILYSNAQKFTPAGGSIQFDVRIVDTGGRAMLRFTCTDTGSGIAEEVAERLFQPFACSRENNQSGTGLGLYSVSSTHTHTQVYCNNH
jgi:K+-sensing histidine kinase KdpD